MRELYIVQATVVRNRKDGWRRVNNLIPSFFLMAESEDTVKHLAKDILSAGIDREDLPEFEFNINAVKFSEVIIG